MKLNLTGRTAVVTGGNMGIGKAIAKGLAAEGVNLVLLARSRDKLEATAAEILGVCDVEVIARPTDISDTAAVNAAATDAAQQFGVCHILVNNAGHRMRRQDRQILWDDADWQADIDGKLVGMLRVTRAFMPHLDTTGAGRIINISGIAGTSVYDTALTHGLNNAAMNHVTGYLARDVADVGITVNAVIPGLIATEWREEWATLQAEQAGTSKAEFLERYCHEKGIVAGRWGSMQEVADVVVFLASDRGQYINGARIAVDGGYGVNAR